MMNKSLLIFFILIIVSGKILANDTIKKYPRFIIDLSFTQNKFIRGNFNYEKTIKTNNSNVFFLSDSYLIEPQYNLNLNFNFLLTPKSKTANQLYVGLGFNYLSLTMRHSIYANSEGKVSGTYVSYSQTIFNHQATAISIVPQLNYQVMFKHAVIINKFGVYVCYLQSKNKFNYDENLYSFNYNNQTNNNILISSTPKKEEYNEKSASLFYNLGFGYRIKHIMPFVNAEVTWLSKTFNQPFVKYQLGISYLF